MVARGNIELAFRQGYFDELCKLGSLNLSRINKDVEVATALPGRPVLDFNFDDPNRAVNVALKRVDRMLVRDLNKAVRQSPYEADAKRSTSLKDIKMDGFKV